VTVTSPTGQSATLTGLRTSASEYDRVITHQATYVARSVITLQVGTNPQAKIVTGVNPLNQVP